MEAVERPENPPQGVVERHIVIAGHGNGRRREAIEKFAGGGKFGAACALGKIAADADEIGFLGREIGEQPCCDDGVVAAEMQIGNMGDRSHGGFGRGTKTRRARGRMREASGGARMAAPPSSASRRRRGRERGGSARRGWGSQSRGRSRPPHEGPNTRLVTSKPRSAF